MKKTYLWLLASLFVAAFTLTACGSDDDEDDKPTTATLFGTKWYEEQTLDGKFLNYETAIFDNNGEVSWGNLGEEQDGKWHKWVRHTYRYTVNGNRFSMGEGDHVQTGTYSIEGDVLKITWDDGGSNVLQMKRMTGSVLQKYNNAINGYYIGER